MDRAIKLGSFVTAEKTRDQNKFTRLRKNHESSHLTSDVGKGIPFKKRPDQRRSEQLFGDSASQT